MVFKELLSMVEQNFGEDFADDLLDDLELGSGGAYTSVGTYDHTEVLKIVTKLSEKTGADARDLVKAFGCHLLETFAKIHPEYFKAKDASEFLSKVDNYIHVEVKKLYPEAELPQVIFSQNDKGETTIQYNSNKPFADLAEGLIEKTFDHFGEKVEIEMSDINEKTSRTFNIKRVD